MKKIFLAVVFLLLAASIILLVFLLIDEKKDKRHITLYGNVDVRQVDLGFRVQGRVIFMPFQEGDYVQKGTLMGAIEELPYSDVVKEAEANILALQASLANAETIFNRRVELLPEGAVSQEDYDNTRTTKDTLTANLEEAIAALGVALKNYHDTKVYCPNDCTILTRVREPGTVALPSEPIYTLSILDPVWVRAFVNETDLGNIYYGMPAKVYTDSGREYTGHIGFISPIAEFTPKTVETTELRTDLVYRLRVIANNPDCYLKQGMPVTVKLDKNEKRGCAPNH